MNARQSSILVVSLISCVPVFADDLKPPAATPRELAHCMMKRLRANSSESYRGAFKACREQFDAASVDAALATRQGATAMSAATLPENPKQ